MFEAVASDMPKIRGEPITVTRCTAPPQFLAEGAKGVEVTGHVEGDQTDVHTY